jgi:hypothetical protein
MKRYTALAGCLGLAAFTTTAMGALTLGDTVRVGSELRFTVTGESNAIYIIEGSTNLQQWQAVNTNRDFAVTRTVSVNVSDPRSYYRARVARPFIGALAASSTISLEGNNIYIDSFDSASTNYSTGSRYDPAKFRDAGDVTVYSALTNSLIIGSAKVFGKAAVGSGGSTILGPSGCVGSIVYVSNPNNGGTIQPGWLLEETKSFFPDAILPSLGSVFTVIPPGSVGGTNYMYVPANYTYRLLELRMSSSTTMLVTGRTTLYVSGTIDIGGNAKIVVAPTGSLVLYVGGPVANMSGSGIVNQTYSALGFQYYGLPGNRVVTLVNDFTGVIYAPQADVTMSIGLSSFDFIGAIVARTVTINGHYKVHYDENLARSGPLF